MTLLHDYFHLRNQQAFQRLLDGTVDRGHSGGVLSSSGGKSWTRSSPLASNSACDVNARDWLGRTVLQLACASPDTVEYVRLLLRHPTINVNLADTESHWTPLHRALYNANLPATLLLLQRSDTDRSLQDLEGYTAFDLYNSTLNATKPHRDAPYAELYTWGANRNAALGHADGGDRVHPDQVHVERKVGNVDAENSHLVSRFFPVYVRQVQMSKLHTAVITSESGGNLRLCGFGSGGRLGPAQHTQYNLKPLQQLTHIIVSVALGQDHTLALTKSGEVLSWGLNRFSQLGYIIEGPAAGESFGKTNEPIQASPRKVLGPLRKEVVKGIAACKSASVCWTEMDVYTWGTNNGQLGYDKVAQPVQIQPRKATKVTQPVINISISDSAMACLLETQDVICIWNDRHIKIVFPGHSFPSEMQPYRPPQAVQDAKIAKITSCDDMFAALSFSGELFTFSAANPSDPGVASKEKSGFKPQRVWALRKKFSSVKDVALGSDGSIIVCTESGHVFIRSRNLKSGQTSSSGKAFKFQRLSTLQRVTQVCANSTGAFGALRVEYCPKPIEVVGNTLAQDLTKIQPHLHTRTIPERTRRGSFVLLQASLNSDTFFAASRIPHDDDSDDLPIRNDTHRLHHIANILTHEHTRQSASGYKPDSHLPHGADVTIQTHSGLVFPAHRIILGARSHVLHAVLSGSAVHPQGSNISFELQKLKSTTRSDRLKVSGCLDISLLILLTFLYTDEVLAPWDHRVASSLETQSFKALKIDFPRVKVELRTMAELLELPTLAIALDSPIKSTPSPSLEASMQQLFHTSQSRANAPRSVLDSDVILLLADKEVHCHSTILRSRSEFFADFFDDDDWTKKRWDTNGVLHVDMKHLSWRVMEYVLKFMSFSAEDGMFDSLEFADTAEEVLEFMFDVMAAANELLLDRLVLLCSAVILQHVNIHNACFILADATYLHAQQLIDRIQSFVTVNMELFLEAGILDDIPHYLVKQLAEFARQKQVEKSPTSRSDVLINELLEKHADWLAIQDFPVPLGRPREAISRKESATLRMKRMSTGPNNSPHPSPSIQPQRGMRRPNDDNDDIFSMDEAYGLPARVADHQLPPPAVSPRRSPAPPIPTASIAPMVWKASSTPRVDMKAVMAEAASATTVNANANPRRATADPLRSQKSIDFKPMPPGAANQHPYPHPQPQPQAGPSSGGWRDQGRPSPPTTPAKERPGSNPGFPSPRRTPGPNNNNNLTNSNAIPGLGPVITPARPRPTTASSAAAAAGSNSPSIRRVSGGKAWTQPPPSNAPPLPSSSTGPGGMMSFVAIQQLQLDQLASDGVGKDRRSLREIQEEEKAMQAEKEFLAWWTAEEERVRLEGMAVGEESGGGGCRGGGGLDGKPGPGTRRRGGKGKADQGQSGGREKGGGAPKEQQGEREHAGGGSSAGPSKRRQQPRKTSQKAANTTVAT